MKWSRAWLRAVLCRIGWDGACDGSAGEIEEQRARMRVLTWQFRVAVRQVLEQEK